MKRTTRAARMRSCGASQQQPGWPVAIGSGFHSSPAIASLDADETDLEVIVGCDDGQLYALKSDGSNAAGWPVTIGDTLFSSPAVADIAGDYHKEVVIGGKDGKIYAYDYLGAKLWEYPTGSAVYRTPALVDLDRDGKCEVLCSAGGALYALDGERQSARGLLAVPGRDGHADLARRGGRRRRRSSRDSGDRLRVYGARRIARAPRQIRRDVIRRFLAGRRRYGHRRRSRHRKRHFARRRSRNRRGGRRMGPYTCGNRTDRPGRRYPARSERSRPLPRSRRLDYDAELEIVVSSRLYAAAPPPEHWEGFVTEIDNTGSIIGGWPKGAGAWTAAASPMPSAISIGGGAEVMTGGPAGEFYSWIPSGAPVYGFPIGIGGAPAYRRPPTISTATARSSSSWSRERRPARSGATSSSAITTRASSGGRCSGTIAREPAATAPPCRRESTRPRARRRRRHASPRSIRTRSIRRRGSRSN